ncbi:GAF and ANTAR domain-containing protein [Marmoricola sp. OAE513]|uniref:GAF and ANTAR domain-containing protein n=1 Tax=Marmoricola sp. OAE513 TaxID=2817894 RepID=UPI001AE2502C
MNDQIGSSDYVATGKANETLATGVHLAETVVPACEAASVFVLDPGKFFDAPAATDPMAQTADALQISLQEGPCLDALTEEDVVICADLEREDRWPAWAARTARETPIRSALCLHLHAEGRRVGALNLFATRPNAFTGTDLAAARAVAEHLAHAVSDRNAAEHANAGLASRTVIGQAEGLLMERFDIDQDRAFAVLKRISQNTNRKLNQVAADLVRTRELPDY